VIARGLSAFDPESVAIAAGRVTLARLHELGHQQISEDAAQVYAIEMVAQGYKGRAK